MKGQHVAKIAAPGVFLDREMKHRGWSQADLAEILNRPIQAVNQILKGKKSITAATARGLEDATGVVAEFWLNLESQFQLSQHQRDASVTSRSELFSRVPIADLRKRGWIRDAKDPETIKADVLKLLRVRSLSDRAPLVFAARKSTDYAEVTPGQEAWCSRVFQIASNMKVSARFSPKKFESSLNQLRKLGKTKQSVARIPKALHELGIRFLIVEHLPRTKIDGATLWLSKTRPVVALTLRYGRIDYFLFTLFHELMHVRYGDALSVDNDILKHKGDDAASAYEARANEAAGALLVPREKLARFQQDHQDGIDKQDIIRFAAQIGIHPGVVLGQLQHRGFVGWSACRELLEPVRETVLKSSETDGWRNKQKR